MASSHLPQWRRFEGYLFNNIIEIDAFDPQAQPYNRSLYRKSGLTEIKLPPSYETVGKYHCYQLKTTMSMMYHALGTQYEDTITVVIRHNPRVVRIYNETIPGYGTSNNGETADKPLFALFNDRFYRIINISSDASHYGSYDYLILKAFKGVKSNG